MSYLKIKNAEETAYEWAINVDFINPNNCKWEKGILFTNEEGKEWIKNLFNDVFDPKHVTWKDADEE